MTAPTISTSGADVHAVGSQDSQSSTPQSNHLNFADHHSVPRFGGEIIEDTRNPNEEGCRETQPDNVPMVVHVQGDEAGDRAQHAWALLDNGSGCSMVFRKTLRALGYEGWINTKHRKRIRTLSGIEFTSIGRIDLRWNVRGGKKVYVTEFIVLEDLPAGRTEANFDFLLGRDWIHEANAINLNLEITPTPATVHYLRVVGTLSVTFF